MNFSIIAVVFLIFSVINSIFSGQKQKKQSPATRKNNRIPPMIKNITNKVHRELMLEKEAEELFESRDKIDGLDYIQIDSHKESMQTESAAQETFSENEEEYDYRIEEEFDFGDIQKSIVLAEVLGPPRVLKRNIR